MKYISHLLFIFFIMNTGQSSAQDLTAISESGTWVVYHNWPVFVWDAGCDCYIWQADDDYTLYKTDGDTLINATNYKKLKAWPLYWDGVTFSTWSPGYHKLAYRNDNDLRAYRIMNGSSTEELWYDFNLQIGDTIEPADQPAAFVQQTYYVFDKDSVVLCDSTYDQYIYSTMPDQLAGAYPMRAAQRVGCTANLIDDNWGGGSYYRLAFFCESPTAIGDMYNLLGVEEVSAFDNVTLFPNPCKDVLSIKGFENSDEQAKAVILDIFGKVILRVDNLNSPISVSELSQGLYYLRILDASGTHSIPFVKE